MDGDCSVKVGANWIIKIIFILFSHFIINDFMYSHKMPWLILVCWIVFALVIFSSKKCTTVGYYRGFDFYLFSFYFKKFVRWEELSYMGIYSNWFICVINLGEWFVGYNYRCVLSNFDRMAELISLNTCIKQEIRQEFIDYVNMRKQEYIISKMFLTFIFFLVCFFLIMLLLEFLSHFGYGT